MRIRLIFRAARQEPAPLEEPQGRSAGLRYPAGPRPGGGGTAKPSLRNTHRGRCHQNFGSTRPEGGGYPGPSRQRSSSPPTQRLGVRGYFRRLPHRLEVPNMRFKLANSSERLARTCFQGPRLFSPAVFKGRGPTIAGLRYTCLSWKYSKGVGGGHGVPSVKLANPRGAQGLENEDPSEDCPALAPP